MTELDRGAIFELGFIVEACDEGSFLLTSKDPGQGMRSEFQIAFTDVHALMDWLSYHAQQQPRSMSIEDYAQQRYAHMSNAIKPIEETSND